MTSQIKEKHFRLLESSYLRKEPVSSDSGFTGSCQRKLFQCH